LPSAPLVIVGGGLAGCLAALALARRGGPAVPFVLIEEGPAFGGNHVWSFFDGDVEPDARALVEPFVTHRWSDHEVRFPRRRRRLGFGYNSVHSSALDRAVRSTLSPVSYRLGTAVREIGEEHVVLHGGERIAARAVIDARGPIAAAGLDLAWQKFVGRTYRFDTPHGIRRPIIMDATVNQADGYRFVYSLPFGERSLMVEDTYYSQSPALDVPELQGRIEQRLLASGLPEATLESEEAGILPVLLGGGLEALWPEQGPRIPRLGLRGGFFHPTTGYSLPDAARNALLLARQSDLTAPALHALFRSRAAALWKERSFYPLLNRMLFRAAEPEQRYRVLEHFYRLPDALVARFYAGRLTAFDKVRILSGKPPVPIGRALAAMREKKAA
jgi:lycopene beta-cyclase